MARNNNFAGAVLGIVGLVLLVPMIFKYSAQAKMTRSLNPSATKSPTLPGTSTAGSGYLGPYSPDWYASGSTYAGPYSPDWYADMADSYIGPYSPEYYTDAYGSTEAS